MTPESTEQIAQARESLKRAKIVLAAGVGEDAGRDAYIACLHAVRAFIFARTGKVAKTHRGARTLFSDLTRSDPTLAKHARFLTEAYALKDAADYAVGADASISLEEAKMAIEKATRFVDDLAALLD